MRSVEMRNGLLCALPIVCILTAGFLMPLLVVAGFSIMPQKSFSLWRIPDFSSYWVLLQHGYYKSLLWSLFLALATVVVLFLLCYPFAFAMARVFKKFTLVITIGVVMSLFVSENIRLFGWNLTLMKGGLLEGYWRSWSGTGFDGLLYNVPVIIFGLVYVYIPFMLFPLAQSISMIPEDMRQAAADLGASNWRILWEIDLPLATPGIVVGSLLSFVLATGALAESKLLGGQVVIVMADEVETAFTYGQNWPLGSALTVVMVSIIAGLAIFGVSRIDLDRIMGCRRVS